MGKIRVREMKGLWIDAALRILYSSIFIYLERHPPFVRAIQPEEMWMYKYPHSTSYFPVTILWPLVILIPSCVIGFFYWLRKDSKDVLHAVLAVTLALSLNGMVTNTIKVIVGRPRPDFFWRCFPDGHPTSDMTCTGPEWLVNDGRKSFPSGHSSFSFAGFGFVSLYLAGKLRVFCQNETGAAWRVSVSLLPLLAATCIAISRTCDYHHHWQDVLVGSILGLSFTTLSYRLYFPAIGTANAHKPIAAHLNSGELHGVSSCPVLAMHDIPEGCDEEQGLIQPREVKWI